ncbi:hypothetical protein AGMMS49992_16310 [Clostridia bacterium]|nr:hypothetical protein AGMMS49992_16310 [Clostridia bacterium]
MSKVVSIITPAYNSERYLERLLASVLYQTYQDFEFFIVNDGSTDATEQIALEWAQLFTERGIFYNIVNKENGHQASCIDTALKLIEGEYFCWPDSDDWFTLDSLHKRVVAFERHPEVAIITCNVYQMEDADPPRFLGFGVNADNRVQVAAPEQYDFALHMKGRWNPGFHMIRFSAFLAAIPSRSIFTGANGAQNVQIMLPVYQHGMSMFLDEPLFWVLGRPDSHSGRRYADYRKWKHFEREIMTIFIETLDHMCIDDMERAKAKKTVEATFAFRLYDRSVLERQWSEARTALSRYVKLERPGSAVYLKLVMNSFAITRTIVLFINKQIRLKGD